MGEYHEEFQLLKDVLYVRLSGTFPNELLRKPGNAFQPLVDECVRQGCKKALVDARNLQVNFDTLSLHQIGEDAAHMTKLNLRVALLAREDMLDSFFDDVIYNRGALVNVFTDENAASDWLRQFDS